MKRTLPVLALAALLSACTTTAPVVEPPPQPQPKPQPEPPQPTEPANFADWQQAFAQRAAAAGIRHEDIQQLLARTHYEGKVVSADRKQPEQNKMIWAYLDGAVSADRIQKGRAKLAQYRGLLQQLENQSGVSAPYIVAIWGMESAYGANTGNIDLIQALSTLAYEGRRRDFAEQQLIALLQLIERGDVRWDELRGSWAGGMGHTQFIPTTFLQYGVDGNGDGRRDPWQIEDALASTANYLGKSGWQRGQRWGREVRLTPDFDYRYVENSLAPAQWGQLGARQNSGAALPGDADTAISHMQIITPEESEQLKKEMGEAEYQKNVNQLTQQLKNMIVSEATDIQKTLKEKGGKIHVRAGEITYTNADKTEAKVVVIVTGERKDGATADLNSQTFSLRKTTQGWKVIPD